MTSICKLVYHTKSPMCFFVFLKQTKQDFKNPMVSIWWICCEKMKSIIWKDQVFTAWNLSAVHEHGTVLSYFLHRIFPSCCIAFAFQAWCLSFIVTGIWLAQSKVLCVSNHSIKIWNLKLSQHEVFSYHYFSFPLRSQHEI